VTPVDIATNTAGTPIPVGTDPTAVAIAPDANTAYVTNFGDGTVTPIELATGTARTPIPVGVGPNGVAVTRDGTTALVTSC
jgi:YVTN family beta-propeller protein